MIHEALRYEIATWLDHIRSCGGGTHDRLDVLEQSYPNLIICPIESPQLRRHTLHSVPDVLTDQPDCTMDALEDEASVVSSSSQHASFARRPILTPTPPSTKRAARASRSPSPTRKILALLERATPPIRLCQPGNAIIQPKEIADLRRLLMKDRGIRVIPRALEVSTQFTPHTSSTLLRDISCSPIFEQRIPMGLRTSLKSCSTTARRL
jgi:hypothetical protein